MPMVNPFSDEGVFGLVSLTNSINLIPNTYGRLNELGLFPVTGIFSDVVVIEMQNHVLRLLPSKPKGGPGTHSAHGKRKALTLKVPHIPLEDVILPEAYANVRAFGMESQAETLAGVMERYLTDNRRKFDITWEFLKWGALKGLIIDGDGVTVLHNLYTEFGITQKTVDFALDVETTDVDAKCREVVRHIEDNLMGDVSTGVRSFVSPEFFDALITHPNVEKFYLNHAGVQQITGNDPRKGFSFAGIVFEEFRGQAPDGGTGDIVRFIAEGEGHAIPMGTGATFQMAAAPGNFLETVNTQGKPLYAKQKIRDFERGVDLWFESNVLPICYRPGVLVKLTK